MRRLNFVAPSDVAARAIVKYAEEHDPPALNSISTEIKRAAERARNVEPVRPNGTPPKSRSSK